MQILLADDHALMRQGIRVLLEREGFSIVAEAADGIEAVLLASRLNPDLVILDFVMPLMNGAEAAHQILADNPKTKAIVVSMHGEESWVAEALLAGVSGFVVKSSTADALVLAINEVMRGRLYLSSGVPTAVIARCLAHTCQPVLSLSTRERQVLQLIAEGNRARAIADTLGLSVKTAEAHRARIMDKLGVHDTAGLVRYAIRIGIVEP